MYQLKDIISFSRDRFWRLWGDQFLQRSDTEYIHLCEHITNYDEIMGLICAQQK